VASEGAIRKECETVHMDPPIQVMKGKPFNIPD